MTGRALATALALAALVGCRSEEPPPPAATPTAAPAITVIPVDEATVTPAAQPTITPDPTEIPVVLPTAGPESPGIEETGSGAEVEEEEAGSGGATLLGILLSDGKPTTAIIEYGGQQEIFRRGDAVFDLGTLSELRKDSVVVDADGKKIHLSIAPPAEPTPEPVTEDVVELPPLTASSAPPPILDTIARTEARAALRDFATVVREAGGKRVPVAGRYGIQLENVEPRSFLVKLGLKSGDILQKVNGIAVSDPEKLPDLASAAEGNEITVSFSRSDVGLTLGRRLQ